MAKDKVIKPLTEEQWQRIRNTPGVVIRERKGSAPKSLPEPWLRVKEPMSARELIGRDLDDYDEDEHLS